MKISADGKNYEACIIAFTMCYNTYISLRLCLLGGFAGNPGIQLSDLAFQRILNSRAGNHHGFVLNHYVQFLP